MNLIELEVTRQLRDIRKCYSKLASAIDDDEDVSSTLIRTALRVSKWYIELLEKGIMRGDKFKVKHLKNLMEATEKFAEVCENRLTRR